MLPPIIDCHIHFRDPDTNRYELQPEAGRDGKGGGVQASRYMPADYFADADGLELAGFIHVESQWDNSDPTGETRWLHELDKVGAFANLPFAVVGFADLLTKDVARILEKHASYPHVRAVRHMLSRVEGRPDLCWASIEYLDHPVWRENYGLLARYGLAFDAMCFGHQMPALAILARRYPETPVYLEHAGLPWDHTPEGRAIWLDGLKALAELPHAYVKISGLGNTVPNWTPETIRPYVLQAIDIFGPERVAFASNFPTDKAFSSMAAIWSAFDEITAGFSIVERAQMFAGNASRLYGLVY